MSVAESKEALRTMTTPEFRKEMSALVRSRSPLVYLVTTEEKRVLEYFRHFSTSGGYRTMVWDCFNGLLKLSSMEQAGLISGNQSDPVEILDWIVKEATEEEAMRESGATDDSVNRGNIYILLDFHRFLKPCSPDVERRLRTLSRMDASTVVIMVGPQYESTPALDKEVRVIDFPYPNKEEIKIALHTAIDSVAMQAPELKKSVAEREEEIINSVMGLSYTEACAALAKSICMNRDLHIPTILKEKQEVIRKTGILQYFNPQVGINDIGGLGNLTNFLEARKSVFTEEARAYGLPVPKGILLIGVPGGGKSLAAKAAAALYEMPLLRLDFGALFGSLMGESEQKARMAIDIAERVAPCVSGDTKILLASGEEITAEKLYEQCLKKGASVKMALGENGIEFTAEIADSIQLVGHAVDSGRQPSVPKPIEMNAMVKRAVGKRKLLQITLSDGRKIKVTPEHKIMVKQDGYIKSMWKEAKDIVKGDSIYSV